MSPAAPPALTEAERQRVEQSDRFVALGEQGVAGLLGMLSDRSWGVRRAVVAGLASLGDCAVAPLCLWLREVRSTERGIAAAVEALVASTGPGADQEVLALAASPVAAVVADAAQILGRRRSTRAAEALSRLIDHPDDNVAVCGIEALGRLGGAASVESLVGALSGDSFFRTFAAIGVLGSLGDPRAIQPLAGLLQDDRYTVEAARALGQSGDRGAIGPLAGLLAQPAEPLMRVAVGALADLLERHQLRFGPSAQLDQTVREQVGPYLGRLVELLQKADEAEQAALCAILGRLDNPLVIPVLLQRLGGEPLVAEQAARALERLARQSEAALLHALRTADSSQRAVLLPLLTLGPEVLGELLSDPAPEVRALSCAAAARTGDASVVERLFALLADPHARVAQAALAAIQALGASQTERLALRAAAAPQPGVRRAALRILAAFGFRSAYDVFMAALAEPDERLRELSAYGLAFVDHPDAFAALCQQAQSPQPRVRAAAMRGLGHRVAEPEAVGVLSTGLSDADPWVRYFACQALGKLGCEAATGAIAARLQDEAGQVRIAALEALAQLRSEAAWTLLQEAAATHDPDVRRAALVGLGLSGRPAAIPLLIAATHSGDLATRLVALSGLAKFPVPEALRELAAAANAEDEQVRSAAVSFLADSDAAEADALLIALVARVEARHPAHAALAASRPARLASVLVALRSADQAAATALTSALVRMKSAAANAALFEAFTLQNAAARKAAAWALAEAGGDGVRAALNRAAAKDPDPEVRRLCSALLARG
jgi:HEAT repeat protein